MVSCHSRRNSASAVVSVIASATGVTHRAGPAPAPGTAGGTAGPAVRSAPGTGGILPIIGLAPPASSPKTRRDYHDQVRRGWRSSWDTAHRWAHSGLGDAPLAELATNPALLAAVGEAVTAANARLARVQQVKRWRLLPQEWTSATGEVTPTLKLRRRVIHASYASVIDELYAP